MLKHSHLNSKSETWDSNLESPHDQLSLFDGQCSTIACWIDLCSFEPTSSCPKLTNKKENSGNPHMHLSYDSLQTGVLSQWHLHFTRRLRNCLANHGVFGSLCPCGKPCSHSFGGCLLHLCLGFVASILAVSQDKRTIGWMEGVSIWIPPTNLQDSLYSIYIYIINENDHRIIEDIS